MTDLGKYIQEKLKTTSPEEIRKDLISQGFMPDQFESFFSSSPKKSIFGNLHGRKLYYFLLIAILVFALLLRFFIINPSISDKDVLTNGEGLIIGFPDEKPLIDDNVLSVSTATEGQGFFNGNSLDIAFDDVLTTFTFDGYYHGIYFESSYVDNTTNETLIEITNNFNLTDGIPQIFITEFIENSSVVAKIYVDEDWREKIVPNYIWWGVGFSNKKIFDYSNEISPGIYVDSVNDSSRFTNNYNLHLGGLAVGDITQEKIDSDSSDVTYVRVK
ncbi:hypothetical protein JXM83_06035 [Candidatus Woesearchaeota archaeon]|nr:hypothetical protein [Candidatus Woesearchaeota archaeon]